MDFISFYIYFPSDAEEIIPPAREYPHANQKKRDGGGAGFLHEVGVYKCGRDVGECSICHNVARESNFINYHWHIYTHMINTDYLPYAYSFYIADTQPIRVENGVDFCVEQFPLPHP